ncbi:nucleophile aminohydrolase [Pelagophyceae sp. CCMP2097]|nr:nucleophile aminohydrolase [Pelagophyceae sp. CCMP2097]
MEDTPRPISLSTTTQLPFRVSFSHVAAKSGNATLSAANSLSKLRGPDATNVRVLRGWTFVHNLLAVTGAFALQPFADRGGKRVALFNGEIYNFRELALDLAGSRKAWASDGEAILPAYDAWGPAFAAKLRGEFAVVVVDFPLWTANWVDGGEARFAVASYESALAGLGAPTAARRMAEPNRALVLDVKRGFSVRASAPVHTWDLRQHKNHTRDWATAFRRARAPFFALSIRGREVTGVVWRGATLCRATAARCDAKLLQLDDATVEREAAWLRAHAEPYAYHHRDAGLERGKGVTVEHVYDSPAAVGLSCILARVRKRGGLIYLSGSGADETISDYAMGGRPIAPSSCFRGVWPEDLGSIFPWCNFYYGKQRAYLIKEELTGGAHGIETRCPFLDIDVVQEYLWLSRAVKNSEYKRPVADYLRSGGDEPFLNAWDV